MLFTKMAAILYQSQCVNVLLPDDTQMITWTIGGLSMNYIQNIFQCFIIIQIAKIFIQLNAFSNDVGKMAAILP